MAALGGGAFETGTAWGLGGVAAVALWLPPGAAPDGAAVVAALTGTVAVEKHDEILAVLEQMDAAHPAYPHWYLSWLGAAVPGHGLGGDLLTRCLETVDAARLPAYLETPNPRTVPSYRRHGFEVVGETTAPSCPPLVLMPRAAA